MGYKKGTHVSGGQQKQEQEKQLLKTAKSSTRSKVRTAQKTTQKGKAGGRSMEQVTSRQITRTYSLALECSSTDELQFPEPTVGWGIDNKGLTGRFKKMGN